MNRTVFEIFAVETSGPDGDNWVLQDAYSERSLARERADRYVESFRRVGADNRVRVRKFVPAKGESV